MPNFMLLPSRLRCTTKTPTVQPKHSGQYFDYRALTRFGTPKIWKNPCYADFFYSVCLFPLRNREFNIPSFVLPGKICDGMKFATKKVEFKKSIL